jgi:hypothetical protein
MLGVNNVFKVTDLYHECNFGLVDVEIIINA